MVWSTQGRAGQGFLPTHKTSKFTYGLHNKRLTYNAYAPKFRSNATRYATMNLIQKISSLRIGSATPTLLALGTQGARSLHALPLDHEHDGATTASEVSTRSSPPQRWSEFLRPTLKALLVDAAGTLLVPSEPAAEVYLRYGRKYGVTLSEAQILERYREAYSTPWSESTIRYVGDGRPFWRFIVAHSTGSANQDLFEDIYEYYARGEAWYVSPGAIEALERIRKRGYKTAVVSNFDSRLRPIMRDLGITHLFDAAAISCEIGCEKPNPFIFTRAVELLGVSPEEAVHVGDDRRNDIYGARAALCYAWLWGADVHNFLEVERRLETGNMYDSLAGV